MSGAFAEHGDRLVAFAREGMTMRDAYARAGLGSATSRLAEHVARRSRTAHARIESKV